MNEKAFYDKRINNLQQVSGYMKSSIRFRELACDLIDAVLYSTKNTKLSLKEYHKFDKTMKKCFDAFNLVVNNSERTAGVVKLSVRNTEVTKELENYLYHIHPNLQAKISA